MARTRTATPIRIPRTLAHVQLIKHRAGSRVTSTGIRYTQGSRKQLAQSLAKPGYGHPSTAIIEYRNGTTRRMSAHRARKLLDFTQRPDAKVGLAGSHGRQLVSAPLYAVSATAEPLDNKCQSHSRR